MNKEMRFALTVLLLHKAKGEDMASLYQMAWDNASANGDTWSKHSLVRHAHETGNKQHLPEAAHGMMHDMAIPHSHPGDEPSVDGDGDTAEPKMHTHVVSKAFASPTALISKSWASDDGATYIEGWISTPDKDLQKDITRPTAFMDAIDGYFAAGAPVSCEHNTDAFPVGHVQKAAIVVDGKVLKEATHPTDSADFEHFPGSGSGVYGRAKLTESATGYAVKAGNIRSFSWIGAPVGATAIPGGGRDFTKILPWVETTVSAYPVNQKAVMLAAKAQAEVTAKQENSMDYDALLAEMKNLLTPATTVETVSKADFEAAIAGLKAEVATALETVKATTETVSKAFVEASREGVGRQAVTNALTIDSDPVAFLIAKASGASGVDALDMDERALVGKLTKMALLEGLTGNN